MEDNVDLWGLNKWLILISSTVYKAENGLITFAEKPQMKVVKNNNMDI